MRLLASTTIAAFAIALTLPAMAQAMQAYADRLGELCRRAPYNWFNFFDFWQRT